MSTGMSQASTRMALGKRAGSRLGMQRGSRRTRATDRHPRGGNTPPGPQDSVHVRRDVLDLEVLVDPLGAALAAEAGGLDAAERRGGVGHEPLVEAYHAGVELLAD